LCVSACQILKEIQCPHRHILREAESCLDILRNIESCVHVLREAESCLERWGAGVETQKNVRGEIDEWGRVPFNEPYAPSLSTIYNGA